MLQHQEATAKETVRTLDADRTLAVPIDDLVEEIYERFQVNPIVLDVEARVSGGSRDTTIEMQGFDRTYKVSGTRVELLIPFTGDAVLFDVRPSKRNLNPPRFAWRGNDLVLAFEGQYSQPDQVKQSLDTTLAEVQQHLAWQRADIEPWNATLRHALRGWIDERRKKVLQDRDLDAFLGVPVAARSNPSRAFVVDPPRRPKPAMAAATSERAFSPEPAISDDGFAAILDVIESVTVAVNRLPQTFVAMPEESLRDVILVVLNNQFGPASGETFSRRGKTDILIPWGGDQGVVFIAECKWWKGPAAFRAAIGQLLGYLTWRDTRAALVVFVRTGSPAEIREKAAGELTAHEAFKRRAASAGHDVFTLAHPTDRQRGAARRAPDRSGAPMTRMPVSSVPLALIDSNICNKASGAHAVLSASHPRRSPLATNSDARLRISTRMLDARL